MEKMRRLYRRFISVSLAICMVMGLALVWDAPAAEAAARG